VEIPFFDAMAVFTFVLFSPPVSLSLRGQVPMQTCQVTLFLHISVVDEFPTF
jgi:hypothetical protein